jgi:RNA polymerase sigma-70 factor, ECF subfamily
LNDPPVPATVRPGVQGRQDLPTSLSLLDRLRVQDQQAWHQFLSLYAPLVVRWCHRRGLREHDIADVAQEIFSRAARYIRQFHKETAEDSLRGWLCRITHREIAQFFRRRDGVNPEGGTEALRRLQQQVDSAADEPPGEEVRHETQYLYQRAVEIARQEFTDETWQMFWRTAVDGVAAPMVAQEMGTTPAAVRQAKSRVLRRLRQAVGDLEDWSDNDPGGNTLRISAGCLLA